MIDDDDDLLFHCRLTSQHGIMVGMKKGLMRHGKVIRVLFPYSFCVLSSVVLPTILLWFNCHRYIPTTLFSKYFHPSSFIFEFFPFFMADGRPFGSGINWKQLKIGVNWKQLSLNHVGFESGINSKETILAECATATTIIKAC